MPKRWIKAAGKTLFSRIVSYFISAQYLKAKCVLACLSVSQVKSANERAWHYHCWTIKHWRATVIKQRTKVNSGCQLTVQLLGAVVIGWVLKLLIRRARLWGKQRQSAAVVGK